MSKSRILLQLDPDPQPSTFDAVVALDAGVDQLLRHGGVGPQNVAALVHGAMFTRGPKDLHHSAIFIGGRDAVVAEKLLEQVRECFFGPMRVSVLLDPNGANTTAAAAVLAAARHVELKGATALVLAATGPVGSRVVRLLAREGASVRVTSRTMARAEEVCRRLAGRVDRSDLSAAEVTSDEQAAGAIDDAQVVFAAGAAGTQLLSRAVRTAAPALRVAIDLNAVPPAGIEGVELTDSGADRKGVACYGAIGIGGLKMKIHKAAVARLFERNDLVLDAEEILALGKDLAK